MTRLHFGDFQLDRRNRQLSRGDVVIPLEPKVFDFVALLAAQGGQLTTSEQVRRTLWPNVVVGPEALRRVVNAARAALGDRGDQQAVIRTRRGVGWELLLPVRSGSAESLEPAALAWPFVGRTAELAQLCQGVREAASGVGSLFLVAGEAGVGKTALANALREASGTTAWFEGACSEDPGTPLCWPFRSLARLPRVRRARQEDEALAPVFPELSGQLEPVRSEPDAEQRFIACQTFARLLGRMAQEAPLHLVVEDVHWADVGTLLVLESLVHVVRQHPVFVYASYRPQPSTRALAQSFERIRHRERVFSIDLPRLSTHEAEELLRGAGLHADAALVTRAAGVPLLLRELVRQRHAGASESAQHEPDLLTLVSAGAARLAPGARLALQRASVLGRVFSVERLATMSGLSPSRARADLEPAVQHGWLRAHGDDYAFTHELVHAAVHHELSEAQRRLHHGEALASYAPDSDALDALAEHAYLAHLTGDRGARPCERAGRAALQALHFERAVVQLGRALELRHGSTPSPELAELALAYARALWEADRDFEAVRGAFSHAAQLARAAHAPRTFARAAIGCACGDESITSARAAGFAAEPVALLDEAVQLLQGEDAGAVHSAARTACWLHTAVGDYQRADESAGLALAATPLPQDAWSLVLAQGMRCARALWARDTHEARAQLSALVQQGEGLLDERRRIEASLQVMVMALVLGETAIHRRAQEELAAIVSSLPPPVTTGRVGVRMATYQLLPELARMSRALFAGAFAEADAAAMSVRGTSMRLALPPSREGSDNMLSLLACSLSYRCALRMLQPLVDDFAARYPDASSMLWVLRAQIALEAGETDAASGWLGELRARAFQVEVAGRQLLAPVIMRVRLSDLCVRVGTREDVDFLYDSLAPGGDMFASHGPFLSLGSIARPLGELALARGENERAVAHFERASQANARAGHLPELVRSRAGLVRSLLTVGRMQEALAMRADVRSQAEQLGMTTLALRELELP